MQKKGSTTDTEPAISSNAWFCMENNVYLQFQMNPKWWQTRGQKTYTIRDETCLRDGGYFLVWLKMFFSDSLRRSSWEKEMTGMSTGRSYGHKPWGLELNRVFSLLLFLYPFTWRVYCKTVVMMIKFFVSHIKGLHKRMTACLHTG